MNKWGDDWDPEVVQKKDPEGRVTLNFKSICQDLEIIANETAHVDDKHPKQDLILEWTGIMLAFIPIFMLSYRVFVFAAIPFMFFYAVPLYRLYKVWKQFGYSVKTGAVVTVLVLAAEFALALLLQQFYPF